MASGMVYTPGMSLSEKRFLIETLRMLVKGWGYALETAEDEYREALKLCIANVTWLIEELKK